MSGHSKWHKVKHQKAKNDPKRGKLFSKLSKQIRIAARRGKPNPEFNPDLRNAIAEAKAANMPKENIERAIQKGAGTGPEGQLENVILEGYGPGGVAVMLKAETDNRNRTIAEIRRIFKDHQGNLGEPGSAAYVFEQGPKNPAFETPLKGKTLTNFKSLLIKLENQGDVTSVYHNLAKPP